MFASLILMIGMPGGLELIGILLLILLLFGAKRIPEFARGLGQGIKEFRNASNEIKKELNDTSKDIEKSINQEENQSKK